MKSFVGVILSVALTLGAAAVTLAFGANKDGRKELEPKSKREVKLNAEENVKTILEIFRAIEQRDPKHPNPQREIELIQPDVEFHWPPALPYGGTFRGLRPEGPTWGDTWNPLEPTEADRRMDPRVVAASGNEVVVLYRQRGVSPNGDRFEGEVLGLYQIREGKLSRAQMFYFDETGLVRFLAKAKGQKTSQNPTP